MPTQRVSVTVHAANLLTANQRIHHMKRAQATKVLRQGGRMAAEAQGLLPMPRAHLTVYIAWPDRRRRDAHNVMPTIKGLVDGMVDFGVLPDDSDDYLIGPDLRRLPETSGVKGVTRFDFLFEEMT